MHSSATCRLQALSRQGRWIASCGCAEAVDSMLAQEIIRRKRDGAALSTQEIAAFVLGLTTRGWSEGQVAALAMAICLRGMDAAECIALTRAMTDSGERLDWSNAKLHGPLLDKHSTGGVGDKVSLVLAPIVAACGGVVPMISGRGLGHTGGTLDKLASLPGYSVAPGRARLTRVLREAGCAIIGASARIAPADRRLYAVRDVTATVESVPLITASILSKKLAAGIDALVMDVKVGNGAFCTDLAAAEALARSLVDVAAGAGLPAQAVISDMNQVLGHSAGNAVEVREAIDFLTGAEREPRLLALTLALAGRMLWLGKLAGSPAEAERHARHALASGAAAERFARMVAGLGGPANVLGARGAGLPVARVQRELKAPRDGVLIGIDTRAVGLAIVALGGGRRRAADRIDSRVGLTKIMPLGSAVRAGDPLLRVHAASADDAQTALATLGAALQIGERLSEPPEPVVRGLIK
ncbi:MAG TPA: thymidine phosphorylase [Albitalea sp.]|nr:thymidine phosphorylase [Albitalea sp.]